MPRALHCCNTDLTIDYKCYRSQVSFLICALALQNLAMRVVELKLAMKETWYILQSLGSCIYVYHTHFMYVYTNPYIYKLAGSV